MKKTYAAALSVLWLWAVVLAPMPALAESRTFEFSSVPRSVRLLQRSTGERVRGFSDVTVTTTGLDAHVWVVPLVLTGGGLTLGLGYCVVNRGRECGQAILGGLVLGASLSLGYWKLLACAEDDAACEETYSEDEEALKRGAKALPLGLAPTVGFVRDRAVFGLGGRF
jgi:hypothetical protein